ncbi:MAG TPA: Gfo/Idh/MocA family oxidoreductase [Terriglobales bacterium]|nr:Gfo/Idh/MocA family oxidoreductase [Terriglobales bacterium]
MTRPRSSSSKLVRYAVVGLGHIAQVAVLPAFAHARNSRLVAVVSGDRRKRRELQPRYRFERAYTYQQYDQCLASGEIDAVYIALPNNMHKDFAIRAARAGVHVLCEKPMAVDAAECEQMIRAAEQNGIKLMIAYRLHFEAANLRAAELVAAGKLGEPRIFNSVFAMQVKPDNIRLERELGGGTLFDIGIYCINAARSVFRAEPVEVTAFSSRSGDRRFTEVDEMTSAILRFPDDRLATFTASFGAADVSAYEVIGTAGRVRLDPAYEYAEGLALEVTVNGRTRRQRFARSDQFAAELVYFSNCVLENRNPEPSGIEGLADVRVIEALYRSAETGKPVRLRPVVKRQRPTRKQEIRRPAVRKPKLIKVSSASQ